MAARLSELGEAAEIIARNHRVFAARELFGWGLLRRSDDRIIGTFTLFQVDEENRHGEIGFAQARDTWGQGYMGEALTAAFRYIFRGWSTTTYRLNEVSTVLVQRTCWNHFRCGARSASLKVKF